jgi:hypothetical protein
MTILYIYHSSCDDCTYKTPSNCTKAYTPDYNMVKKYNWLCVPHNQCMDIEKFVEICDNKITSIVIIIVSYISYRYVYNNMNFFKSTDIPIYIWESDIYSTKEKMYNIKKQNHENYEKLNNIYILTSVPYLYEKFFPKINKNILISFHNSVNDNMIVDFNNNPINKILLSGSVTSAYPARKKVKNLMSQNPHIALLKVMYKIYGINYTKKLNEYLCCFTCCLNDHTPYIVTKFFEIPASGSLLLAYDADIKQPLNGLGFIDGVNYMSCTLKNINDKINYIVDPKNRTEIDTIRKNGYEFVLSRHKLSNRVDILNTIINKNNIK